MERPDFFTLKNGEKVKLPFTDQEYQRRLTNLTIHGNKVASSYFIPCPSGLQGVWQSVPSISKQYLIRLRAGKSDEHILPHHKTYLQYDSSTKN